MKLRHWIVLSAAMALVSLSAQQEQQKTVVTRVALVAMEKSFDQRIARYSADDPIDLLGATRGLYLDGYGAVFTTELSPVIAPGITPFRPVIAKDQVLKLWEKKKARLPVIRQTMLDMLVSSASGLKDLPVQEQIVVGVNLHYYSWEDKRELPSQILMQASRKSLLDFEAKRITRAQLDSQLRLREL